jgi:hypothetical protein
MEIDHATKVFNISSENPIYYVIFRNFFNKFVLNFFNKLVNSEVI